MFDELITSSPQITAFLSAPKMFHMPGTSRLKSKSPCSYVMSVRASFQVLQRVTSFHTNTSMNLKLF